MSLVTKTRLILISSSARKNKIRCRNYGKLSYMHHLGSEPLKCMNLGNLLESSVKKYRDIPAIISRSQRKTIPFGNWLEESDRLAAGLLALGLKRGDRVGLCVPNRYEFCVVLFACARADLILVALNPAYQAPELEFCINKVGIKAVICNDTFKTQDYYNILNSFCPEISKSEPGKINSTRTPTLKNVILFSEKSFRGTNSYNEILALSNEKVVKDIRNSQHTISPESPSVIQFTSGTTGSPKAAVVSHFSMVNNSYVIAKRGEFHKKHHVTCLPNPLFHAFGIVLGIIAPIHFGTTAVIPSVGYNPNETLDAVKEEKCTVLFGTPTMHVDLIDVQSKRNEDINPEIAITGGALCSPQLFKNMRSILKVKKVKSVYGLSESTAVVFHSMEEDDEYHSTKTVGHLGEHLEAKIIDVTGQIVPFGEVGELCIRGYTNMLEYWEDERSKETKGPDGWLKTGDQFILDESGYGRIVGRLKDMVIRGGENIFPKEIEEFLDTHPDILEAQVIGLPHERLGEEVCALIRLKEGKTLTREELVAFCKGKIAHFKIPSIVKFVTDFPKTASGKIQKFKLKELVK